MTFNKKHCLLFLTFFIILLVGLTIVSATEVNDGNNTQKNTDNKELSTHSNYNINKVEQSEARTTSDDEDEPKEDIITYPKNKEITKNTEKTTKQETQPETVNNYEELSDILTNTQKSELIINLDGPDEYTSNGIIKASATLRNLTINGNSRTITGNNQNAFLDISIDTISNDNINLVITNLNVNNCKGIQGAAILFYNLKGTSSNITIINSSFTSNSATGSSTIKLRGGAIYQYLGNMTIINSSFTGNLAQKYEATLYNHIYYTGNGGAVAQGKYSNLTIENSNFTSNKAGLMGGVIYQEEGYENPNFSLIISNSKFEENEITSAHRDHPSYGGVIYQNGGIIIINDTVFNENIAEYYGGAIYQDNGNTINYIELNNCNFTKNHAVMQGGVVYTKSNINITNSNFTENYVASDDRNNKHTYGGVIYFETTNGVLNLFDSKFTSNYVKNNNYGYTGGGAIYQKGAGGVININNSEFDSNNATNNHAKSNPYSLGGAIYVDKDSAGELYINNSYFTSNTVQSLQGKQCDGGAIYAISVSLDNTNLTGNKVSTTHTSVCYGGAIYADNINCNHCNFTNNTAPRAGAIYFYSQTSSISNIANSTFKDNWVSSSGSSSNSVFYFMNFYRVKIINNTFINNTDNTRDMLFSGLPGEVHDNVYIDNYLSDILYVYDDIISQDYEENITLELYKSYQNMYNDTIRNGTIILYLKGEVIGSFNVNDGNSTIKIKITDLPEKDNEITVKYVSESKHYQNITKTFILTKDIINTNITVSANETVKIGKNVTINGTLTQDDDENTPLSQATIKLYINDNYINETHTDSEGNYVFTYPTNVIGEQNIIVNYTGEGKIQASSNKTKFTVIAADTNTTISAKDIIIGQNTTISGVLYDIDNNEEIKDTFVSISIDENIISSNVPVDNEGKFELSYNVTSIGEHNVKVDYTTDNPRYTSSSNTTSFKVSSRKTNITINNNESVLVGQKVNITGTLYDQLGQTITNINLTVRIGDNYLNEEVFVDETGKYELSYETTNIGEYTINVTYNSDNINYTSSTNTSMFNVIARNTSLTIENNGPIKVGENLTVYGILTDELGEKVINTHVNIKVGTQVEKVPVDGNGYYEHNFTLNNATTYEIIVEYINETDRYNSTRNTTSYTLEKTPTNTQVKVINDKVGNVTIEVSIHDKDNLPINTGKITVTSNKEVIIANKTITSEKTLIKIPSADNTTLEINVNYLENNCYKSSNNSITIKPIKLNTTITIEAKTPIQVGDTLLITGKLVDENNNPVNDMIVQLLVDNKKIGQVTTNQKGIYTFNLNNTTVGTHNLKSTYNGNKKYVGSQASGKFEVLKVKAIITLNVPGTITLNDMANISGNIKDNKGRILAYLPVNVTVNSKKYTTTTDKNGNYKLTNVNKVLGQNVVTVTAGNTTVESKDVTKTFNVRKLNTTITISPTKDTIVEQKVNITGKLVDDTYKVVSKASITVTFDGVSKSVTTDNNGKYLVEFPTSSVGQKQVTILYAGNGTYNGANTKGTVNIVKNNATLTVNTPTDAKAGRPANITGSLKDKDGKPVANTPINVTVNGKTYQTTTDKNGNYKIQADNIVKGQNNVTVSSKNDKYNIKSVTSKFSAKLPEAKITVNKVSDAKMGDNITISGKLVDEQNKPIQNAAVTVNVNGKNYKAITDKNGNYKLTNPEITLGTNNVTVKYENSQYTTNTANTSFKITKVKSKITVKPIKGTLGEDITFIAYVNDENGNKITGGNVVFKLNGKTLRVDGSFNSNASPLKINVINGIATYTIKAELPIRDAKNVTASYSGTNKYEESKANIANFSISKRYAQVKVSVTPKMAKQNTDIVFTATLKDVTPNAKNTTCITTNGNVLFKLNGKTLKDSKGNIIRLKATSTVVNYAYHVPTGMGGVDANGVRNYTVEAIYNNSIYYPDARGSSTFNVERSIVNINFIKTSVKSNVLSVKATFTDYENNYLVGNNKVCVKINGKTYQENGEAKYFIVKDGKVNLSGIKIASGTKVKSVTLVTGAREAYLGARETTTDIKTN